MDDQTALYDRDILAWTEQQAAALRDLAARRDLPNALDLPNVIEEIEALGRSELRAATSPIRLILVHLLKILAAPDAPAVGHWRAEIVTWHGDIEDSLTPAMHQRIDLDALWRRARREAAAALAQQGAALPAGLPDSSPLTLADFTAPEFDIDAAVARLRATMA